MNLQEQLVKIDGTTQMVDSCLKMVEDSPGIIIFGAGVGG